MSNTQRIFRMTVSLASMLPLFFSLSVGLAASQPQPQSTQRLAEIVNFNTNDLLDGNDGFTPHPMYPLKYGAPVLRVDEAGNGMEEHAAHVAFFEGKYYLYTETWACGRILYFSGTIPGQSKPPGYNSSQYPEGDNGGRCGIAAYSSPDLRRWTREDLYYPTSFGGALVSKPRAFWSAGLGKYVLWFHSGNALNDKSTLWVAVSEGGPAGPWGEPALATGDNLSHDYAIAIGPDGAGWIVTDVWAGSFDEGSLPFWSVWVQKLNADMTGVAVGADGSETAIRIFNESHWEAIGLFHREGLWYITSGGTCSNCEADIKYIRARDPLGPWFTEDGDEQGGEDEARLIKGDIISEDGCGSQAKGASVLPSPEGPVVVTWGWAYRTSPSNYLDPNLGRMAHADNMQAISSQLWFRPEFDDEGRILPYRCESSVRIPLQAQEQQDDGQMPSQAYQPDCRVRVNTTLSQEVREGGPLMPPLGSTSIEVPVFQRTDDLGPFLQDGVVLDGELRVKLEYEYARGGGAESESEDDIVEVQVVVHTWPAHNISHAPEVISVPVTPSDAYGRGLRLRAMTLETNATNGCYGVLVEPKQCGAGDYGVRVGSGSGSDVKWMVAPKAQLFVHRGGTVQM
ncbi:glycosyl hydrolase [Plectosphaerella plurivora]|uniref:Glycosyl hydrolase n=1 Tax=Plectosphaerella plurivora TaxID=936078 RepID=A0A9P8V2A0_9PEZI|nr:glycosyl hydrolase [Plectosphaerella plurivora]